MARLSATGWVALLLVAALVEGKPFLNKINDFDLSGNICPNIVQQNVPCPNLCVADIKLCPSSFRPSCPNGQSYCPDGTCQSSCANVQSTCSCSYGYSGIGNSSISSGSFPSSQLTLYPCQPIRINVTEPKQGPTSSQTVLAAFCYSALGLSASPTFNDPFFQVCLPRLQPGTFSVFSPDFASFYIVLGVEVMILAIHGCFKFYDSTRYRDIPPTTKSSFSSEKTFFTITDENNVELQDLCAPDSSASLRFLGFKTDWIGSIVRYSVLLTSVTLMALLGLLIGDYYGVFAQFTYKEETMIFVNHDNLSQVFILIWHICMIWFFSIRATQNKTGTYFGRRCSLRQATIVQVEKKVERAVYLTSMGPLVNRWQKMERRFKKFLRLDRSVYVVPVKHTPNGIKYIEIECIRYVFDERAETFEQHQPPIALTNSDLHASLEGLAEGEAMNRANLMGPNAVEFRGDTLFTAVKNEFTGYFYIYQFLTLSIWYYYAYYQMGLVLTIVIVASGLVKVMVGLRAQKRVLEMVTFSNMCKVKRGGRWETVNSIELVPGDVVAVESSEHVLSVDCVLVDGGAVADESSLTGEALPVAKFPIKNDAKTFSVSEPPKANTLYAGCHILQTQPDTENSPTMAVVLATGPNTCKGRLVRDILYPTAISFTFTEHLKMVIPVLIIWGFVMLIIGVKFMDVEGVDSWFYGMFTISQVLSPLLPAVLVIGQSVAAERLAKKGIMCVDLARITLAGKTKIFCFDKTGTLTKEGLQFRAIQPVDRDGYTGPVFAPALFQWTKFPRAIQLAMLTCHSITSVNDEFVGNFVDVEMFKFTNATLGSGEAGHSSTIYPPNDRPLHIVKRFEFIHAHGYMTSVIRDDDGHLYVQMKGSPEKIRELVDPASIPNNFESVLTEHTASGCYVLGFAVRQLPPNLSAADIQSWDRDRIEQGAEFAGLIVFRNELKEDTVAALRHLRDGGCRTVMITGDNLLTGVHVAKQCEMIPLRGAMGTPEQGKPVVVLYADVNASGQIVWKNHDDDSAVGLATVMNLVELSHTGAGNPVELAVTGKAFNLLIADGLMRKLLLDIRVFARMSPEDKIQCVRLHMQHAVTAMCGDGGNDAGALKAAHAGIALSEAESSVVSHFSSRDRSINACVEMIKEGRCSLDVSFANYKYLIMYGEVLAFSGLVQAYFTVSLNQWTWILIDGSTIPISWALTMAKPAPTLSESRPTARLIGVETITSVVGQIFIDLVFLVGAVVMLFRQPWFVCHEFNGANADVRRWWELGDNFEAEVIGILSIFQIFHAAAAFNLGSRYRSGFLKNYIFIGVYVILAALLSFLTLGNPNLFGCIFHINCGTPEALQSLGYSSFWGAPSEYYSNDGHNVMPMDFRWKFWALCMGNLIALLLFEGLVVLGPIRNWAKQRWPLNRESYRL
ncbi:uncharacterized protein BJ171DRAFT_484440 [Polychytrium aggregatum]|uniref:uncharacterized protein n=1 Tax=Polychytrium aggregatum TaxID=110093 RepID=UPI0022FF1B37|nr:uncharacterized protein BJ171DRAFT_484440 [Polychytrium aggregatum]KAI9209570.1 hypothetical protein BJ171DRAFT_484440 [Polychytrium aggregatum]